MTNSKSTKRALLTSSISLILCFAMLLGTTFAWFTDSASTGVNKIQSGNLDINVYYATSADVVDGKIPDDSWEEVKKDTQVFNPDALWEPGYTEVVYFKIENAGSLALKYIMSANIASETAGINKDGDEFNLSDYLSAYYMTGDDATVFTARDKAQSLDGWASMVPELAPATLAEAVSMETGKAKALSYENALESGEVAYTTMAIFMPTTVGDEANYKTGETAPSINLGINFAATQYTYEKDSYDDQYDKDAKYPVVDAEGLAGAITEGKDVKLEADITLDEAIEVAGDIDVDLNGFNLDASKVASAFKVEDDANLTINGKDENVELGVNGLVDVAAGADAVIEINGGNFTSDDAGSTLIKSDGDGEIKIVLNNVNYKSTATNGYALDCSYYDGENLSVEINGGSFEATTGLILPAGSKVNGAEITAKNTKNMQPAVYATGDMTIQECIIKAEKSHAVAVAGGATLNVINCDVYAGTDAGALAFQVFSSGGTINVTGGSYKGGYGTTGKVNPGRVAIIIIDGVEKVNKKG